MSFRLWLANAIAPPAPYLSAQEAVFPQWMRAPGWGAVRNEWLRQHPHCEACGVSFRGVIQVHHIIPVHTEEGRARELDHANLITLCVDGPGGMNCHYIVGHGGYSWRDWNLNVWEDAKRFRKMLNDRCRG